MGLGCPGTLGTPRPLLIAHRDQGRPEYIIPRRMPIMEISRSNLAADSGFSSLRNIAHYAEQNCRAIAVARHNTTRTQPDTAGRTKRHDTTHNVPRCAAPPTARAPLLHFLAFGLPIASLCARAPRKVAKLQKHRPKFRPRSASSCHRPLRRPVACVLDPVTIVTI